MTTLTQIESFLTLASVLNYSKASEMLHTTQPNLSKIVVNLEQELGVKLLYRNTREVRLTAAGAVFSEEMQKLMTQYHYAVGRARDINAGIKGALDVGIIGTALIHKLRGILYMFRKLHPEISLNIIDYTYPCLRDALAKGKVDIAMLPDRELDWIPRLKKKFLFADSMCAVIHKKHRYAGKNNIDLSVLKDEPFVTLDPKISKVDFDMVIGICIEQNFMPKVALEVNSLNNLLLAVECDLGFCILAEHMSRFAPDNVTFIRLNGYENFFRVCCLWNNESNQCIPRFGDVIDEYLIARDNALSSGLCI